MVLGRVSSPLLSAPIGASLRLADFIIDQAEPILAEWEVFARSISAGAHLDTASLRDHASEILHATARDMRTRQTDTESDTKSKGGAATFSHASDALDGASDLHAFDRLGLGFNMVDVMSEYRALRASVLRLWHASSPSDEERNVDDLTRFNESIDQSLSKAVASFTQRIDQARDMFLAILSHDLRNPLGAIAMTAQALPLFSNDKEELLACGLQITRSATAMERMIADLLDYTRTRLGAGMPVNPAPMDLSVLIVELVDEFRASHPDREIRVSGRGDLTGQWDTARVRQAISNLLGNALQHGAPDSPATVSLTGDADSVFIAIHNFGDAILAAEMPRIFDPLVRGSGAANPRKNRPGSIGMGLYIAREVARSHGGELSVISTRVDGTTFTLRLPRAAAPRPGQPILNAAHISTM